MRSLMNWLVIFAGFTLSAGFAPGENQTKKPAPLTDLYGDPLPDGAVARMGSVRMRHAGLADFVFMPDGKTVLSAGSDRILRYWDLATGQQMRKVKLQRIALQAGAAVANFGNRQALAPDAKNFAAVDNGKIVVWEVDSGQQIKTISAPGGLDYLVFSPDGKTLAAATNGGQITFLEWATGKERQWKLPVVMDIRGMDSTYHGSFSSDSKWFVGGASWQQPLGIYDLTIGREAHRLTCQAITSRVSPDCKRLAVVSGRNDQGENQTVIRIFDMASGKEVAQLPQGSQEHYYALTFSAGGKTLACGFSDQSCLLDLSTGRVVYRLPGRQLSPIFAPDGKTLVTSDGHRLHCWDAATGKELQHRPGEFGFVPILAVSPDGTRLASGDWMRQTVDIWDTTSGRQIHQLPLKGEKRYVRNLRFASDGKTLISAQGMGFLQYWDVRTGEERRTIQLDDPASANRRHAYFFQVYPSTDGKHIATLERVFMQEEKTRLGLWETATGKPVHEHFLPAGTRACAWLDGGASIAFPQKDGLTMMEVGTSVARWDIPGTTHGGPLAASPDGRLLAVLQGGPQKGTFEVGLWEVVTGKKVAKVATGRVAHLAVAADNRSLVTTDEGFLRVWDLATGKERSRRPLPEAGTDSWGKTFVFAFLLSPDGKRAFTALADGTALVWDLTSALPPIGILVKDAGPNELATWWDDLVGDPERAYAAVWRMAEVKGGAAVSFLRRNLKSMTAEDIQTIRTHIKNLDSELFKVREHARKQLELAGGVAVPTLRNALESNPSLEVRRRLESLLSRPLTYPPETLRQMRAIQVLERVASNEARRFLAELAGGILQTPQTQEAKASLERLSSR